MGINMTGGIQQDSSDGAITSLSLSETFDKCAKMLQSGLIKDFSLTRTTMSEVFTDFAKF